MLDDLGSEEWGADFESDTHGCGVDFAEEIVGEVVVEFEELCGLDIADGRVVFCGAGGIELGECFVIEDGSEV